MDRTPFPHRSDFADNGGSAHFTWAALAQDSDFDPIAIPGRIFDMAESVRAAYNNAIDTDPETDYGLRMTSGYRNPIANDRLPLSSEASLHQWGNAVDLAPLRNPESWPPGYDTYDDLMNLIYEVAVIGLDEDLYDFLLHGGHVHIEYDPQP